jgi:hypothetical protein
MPATIRQDKKAEKIAWAILGKPTNLQEKQGAAKQKVDKKIQGEIVLRDR